MHNEIYWFPSGWISGPNLRIVYVHNKLFLAMSSTVLVHRYHIPKVLEQTGLSKQCT